MADPFTAESQFMDRKTSVQSRYEKMLQDGDIGDRNYQQNRKPKRKMKEVNDNDQGMVSTEQRPFDRPGGFW